MVLHQLHLNDFMRFHIISIYHHTPLFWWATSNYQTFVDSDTPFIEQTIDFTNKCYQLLSISVWNFLAWPGTMYNIQDKFNPCALFLNK